MEKPEEPKDCAFQYATPRNIIENTELITLSEARELWKKYLPDFIKKLQNDQEPEMGIWVNMKNSTDYRESIAHLDYETQTDGNRVWNIKKEYFDF